MSEQSDIVLVYGHSAEVLLSPAESSIRSCRVINDAADWRCFGSAGFRPWDKGGTRSPKKFFSVLRASVWSKNKGDRPPRAPPLDSPLFGICPSLFQVGKPICMGLTSPTLNIHITCWACYITHLNKDETVIPRGLAYFPLVPSMPT